MKTLAHLIWLIFGGLEAAFIYFIAALICSFTIVFIPIGLQLFKLSSFILSPFGKKVIYSGNVVKSIINILYAVLIGWILSLVSLVIGLLLCCTIIGIPYGLQYFKIALFALFPVGTEFYPDNKI